MSQWRWISADAGGDPVAGVPSPVFPTRVDAETWLGESWQELADAGVATVSLHCDDHVVYGPMSLAAG